MQQMYLTGQNDTKKDDSTMYQNLQGSVPAAESFAQPYVEGFHHINHATTSDGSQVNIASGGTRRYAIISNLPRKTKKRKLEELLTYQFGLTNFVVTTFREPPQSASSGKSSMPSALVLFESTREAKYAAEIVHAYKWKAQSLHAKLAKEIAPDEERRPATLNGSTWQ
jgi:hypothetical protein